MKKAAIGGGAVVLLLIFFALVAGDETLEQDAAPLPTTTSPVPSSPARLPSGSKAPSQKMNPSSEAEAEIHPSFLYGRVTAVDGATYEGRLRWGSGEEAYWGNYFNGFKDENPWLSHVPPDRLTENRLIEIFGFEIRLGEGEINFRRPFMARFGDIARIEAVGGGVLATLQNWEFDPDVRVTLKSGTVFELNRLSAGDFDDGVRVWEAGGAVVDLRARQIRAIEFLSTDRLGDVPSRLHGRVHTRSGDFTGFLQWDREEAVGTDRLVGLAADGPLDLPFNSIRSIARHTRDSSLVTLLDGREIVLAGNRKVGKGNRGIYVDDGRYGRVLVSWDAFERADFSPGGHGPSYRDFPPGLPLRGRVTTRAGRHFAGRLVYDLDESEITETLDSPSQGVNYTILFGLVASILLPGPEASRAGHAVVTLHSGEQLQLERTGDLGGGNAGLLIFVDGREDPEYVPWEDIEQIDFERPLLMYPPPGG